MSLPPPPLKLGVQGGLESSPEIEFLRQIGRQLIVAPARRLQAPPNLDWPLLESLADLFNWTPVLHQMLEAASVPPHLFRAWGGKRMQVLLKNTRMLKAATRMFRLLEQAGVPTVGLRGISVAHRYYPDPSLRPMSDIDLLVCPGSQQRARHALEQQGILPQKVLRSQLVYELDGAGFEMHWHLMTPKRYRTGIDDASLVQSRVRFETPEGPLFGLSAETELICLAAHAYAHHDLDSLMPLLDMGLLLGREPLNWNQITKCGCDAQWSRMLQFTFGFANDFWRVGDHQDLAQLGRPLPAWLGAQAKTAYWRQLFPPDSLPHFLWRKRTALYLSEEPATKMRQIIRWFSRDVMRELLTRLTKRRVYRLRPTLPPAVSHSA